jgi:hypothetical protein
VSASIRRLRADDAAVELLREIRDLLKRAEQRRQSPAAVPMLLGAFEERFGPGRFTVRTVLGIVDEDPHSALSEAVAQVVDMNLSTRSRATSFGALLVRLREVEVVAEQRGASIYRLRRTSPLPSHARISLRDDDRRQASPASLKRYTTMSGFRDDDAHCRKEATPVSRVQRQRSVPVLTYILTREI